MKSRCEFKIKKVMKNRKRTQILAISLFICLEFHLSGKEICNNGIDDVNDGFLDCMDNDCNNLRRSNYGI
ncbi:MAG: hypothetical protein ACI86M_002576 [Saprospiraceae bacterium]